MKSLSICFLIFIAVISSALSWHNMVYRADTLLPFTNDEIVNLQASTSFFSNGVCRNYAFGLFNSSGIAVIWPGAVGWYLGRNMLASRLGCAFFSWFFSLVLGFCFFIRNQCTRIESVTAAICLWGLTITSPLALPHWFGFMYNLGELNTIILVGFGLFLLFNHPLLSVFIFGIAFWHGKFIYFPLIWGILLGNIFSQKLSAQKKITKILGYAIIFLLPLFIWIGWLFLLKFDTSMIKEWLSDQLHWFGIAKLVHLSPTSFEFSLDILRERLSSPKYEWASYTFGTKMKDLLFSFGAIGITLIGLIVAKRKALNISDREKWISIMATISIGLYCIFYFFIGRHMYQRYLHPAIYTGFGLFVFWCSKWVKNCSSNLRLFFYVSATFLIILQGVNGIKHPLLQPQPSYARSCTDLYGAECHSNRYK